MWAFKDNPDPREWNIFVSPKAGMLVSHGYRETRARLWQKLADMGCTLVDHSINRVDYAMDFLVQDFSLTLEGFVAHARSKVRPYWTNGDSVDTYHPFAVFSGRQLQGVTIGKMPGCQIVVYDKRRAAIEQRKLFWFDVWKIDRHDDMAQVWRIELRAGKQELARKWQNRSFSDLDDSIGDVFLRATTDVRYVDHSQTDSNVKRQRPHALWRAVVDHLENSLLEHRSGLLPNQVRSVARQQAVETHTGLVLGNLASLAVALGVDSTAIREALPALLQRIGDEVVNDDHGRFVKSLKRAKERLHFIVSPSGG